MMDDIECFWNGTIATNDPLTNSMLPNWGYLNTFFRYIRKPGLFFVLWFLVFYLFSFFSSSWIAFYRTLIGVFLLFFQKNLPSYFFFNEKSKWILHMVVKNRLMPALSHVILGASKDSSLTYTSDGRQPKPHTVLSTTDRNLKLAPGY